MTAPTEDAILADLERAVAKATQRAIRRLARLPLAVRQELDPHGLLLRPRPRARIHEREAAR